MRDPGDFGVRVEVCFSALLHPSFKEMAAFLPHELFVALEKVVDLVANLGHKEAIRGLRLEHALAHLLGSKYVLSFEECLPVHAFTVPLVVFKFDHCTLELVRRRNFLPSLGFKILLIETEEAGVCYVTADRPLLKAHVAMEPLFAGITGLLGLVFAAAEALDARLKLDSLLKI